jgi:hypothetical protein
LKQVARVREQLAEYWGADRPETGDDYLDSYYRSRSGVVAETWDHMGIIVPRKKYRPLSAGVVGSDRRLDPKPRLVKRLAAEAMQLLRDGFPGAALKLGRDLWVLASDFPVCYDLLGAAYAALKREPLRRLMNEARAFRADCDS